eukprot:8362265-Alexandrium_andersonii.AAC.1
MSASLVGSEMCIRDRSWTARFVRERRSSGGRVCKTLAEAGLFPGVRHPCLLYTSDAADDM